MKTGNLIQHGRMPGAIAVSRSIPKFLDGKVRRFERLAPPAYMHRFDKPRFCRHFFGRVLHDLDPLETWNWLHELVDGHEPVLCCWERLQKAEEFCHRTMIAAWFRDRLGEVVDELEPPAPAQLRLPGC